MKRNIAITLIFLALASVPAIYSISPAYSSEEEAVRVALDNYLKAHATGDPAFLKKAFHKDARIMAFSNDKLLNISLEEFAGRFNGKPAADEAMRKRRIVSIDITGTAATAKIELDYPKVKFTDYMSLLKIDGEWQIVNKIFQADYKEAS
ncbi:MAG: nuclear transport factor 2 family protein [Pyrinomonadaceae bacterium]